MANGTGGTGSSWTDWASKLAYAKAEDTVVNMGKGGGGKPRHASTGRDYIPDVVKQTIETGPLRRDYDQVA